MWKDRPASPEGPRSPVAALLDNIRSAFNVGDMFRSADALRLGHLYLAGITAFPPNSKLEKTALGSTDSVPWSHHLRVFDAAEQIRSDGYQLVAIEMTPSSQSLFEWPGLEKPCFVFGHEVLGVDRELLRQADAVLHLPMMGMKNSLNVSSSFAVTLYHFLDRFGQLPSGSPELTEHYLPNRREE
ncbi:MAG: RNA methyltransferase [Candidatus Krumholzibacteria bacterium]|jgi:tRNA G18 (ribose-2'-O)-methylase SpoU|nr:RNA methyltransferase [Candidatus Krumholzibacteria bacterium]MDP6796269.1 RNA methyltransferase [Candidatus Krumholzibacteria bacterium]MDP7021035.1 RNA methyltransferase [Candidatus Krumholzibacteria bacterium]